MAFDVAVFVIQKEVTSLTHKLLRRVFVTSLRITTFAHRLGAKITFQEFFRTLRALLQAYSTFISVVEFVYDFGGNRNEFVRVIGDDLYVDRYYIPDQIEIRQLLFDKQRFGALTSCASPIFINHSESQTFFLLFISNTSKSRTAIFLINHFTQYSYSQRSNLHFN